jgi:hypothetical protein
MGIQEILDSINLQQISVAEKKAVYHLAEN